MKAIVIGATGATGKDLVKQLLEDNDFEQVDVFVRRQMDQTNPKLKVHVVDFESIDSWKDEITGDVLFSMLGTTLKQAGSQKKQWRIDYDYQYEVAKAARSNDVQTIELMSSVGASSKSIFFYSRMKGALEEAVKSLSFPRTIIMRPPSLIRKGTDRPGERISVSVLQFFNRMGLLKGLAPMPTEVVAEGMIKTSKDKTAGLRVIEASEMVGLCKSAPHGNLGSESAAAIKSFVQRILFQK